MRFSVLSDRDCGAAGPIYLDPLPSPIFVDRSRYVGCHFKFAGSDGSLVFGRKIIETQEGTGKVSKEF